MIVLLALLACTDHWMLLDADGDGWTLAEGDCWDSTSGPGGTSGADIHPGAADAPYDGIDADCAQGDDFDHDGDGYVPDAWVGAVTVGIEGSGTLPGGDCWDEGDQVPADFVALAGYPQPAAADVHPAATEAWYDGVDGDCDLGDDFDQDLDGHRAAGRSDASGAVGDDCFDEATLAFDNPAGLAPALVHPGADETCYDGTDANCDGWSDWDCDVDGYLVHVDCDDLEPTARPEPDALEVWYNGIDENCDNNDGDQDGDGFVALGYGYEVPAGIGTGDCWDDPTTIPEDMTALHAFSQPEAIDVGPDEDEVFYDGIDQDCDGRSDFDQDGDGHDTDAWDDRDGVTGDDCDDSDALRSPSAVETCNTATDDDCDLDANDEDATGCTTWYTDGDLDGYGGTAGACLCEAETPYVAATSDDCDDAASDIHPGAQEDCGTASDEDCDGGLNDPDALGCTTFYSDADLDTYGGEPSLCLCVAVAPYLLLDGQDCDDLDAGVHPGVSEVCDDGQDNDCDGSPGVCALTGAFDVDAASAGTIVGTTATELGGALASGDGDGLLPWDALLGAPASDAAYLFMGPLTAAMDLTAAAVAIHGASASGFGRAVGLGDFDHDGTGDLVIGAPMSDLGGSDAGSAHVFFGPFAGSLDDTDADVALEGTTVDDLTGWAVATGDWDMDGAPDLALTANADDVAHTNAGAIYVFLGPLTASTTLALHAARHDGGSAQDRAGTALSTGDLDGDGTDDLLIGAPGYADGASGAGGAFVVLDPSTTSTDLADADRILAGSTAGDGAGEALAVLGDADADGSLDLAIAAPASGTGGTDGGAVYLVYGPLTADRALSSADAVVLGAIGDRAGTATGSAGDIDHDGRIDLFVGAPGVDAGQLGLFYGPPLGTNDLLAADLLLVGTALASNLGTSAASIDDTDGDGIDDFLVGAPGDPSGGAGAGAAYTILGGGF